jgi:hypothetical protein
MQAERKELERNALVTQLNRAYEGLRQGPSRGTVMFFLVVLGVLAIFVVFRWFYLSSEASASERWYELDEVLFPQQLETLLDKDGFKDTPQHRLARFKDARMKLSEGLRELGNPNLEIKNKARDQIQDATKIYEDLTKTTGRVPLLHQEALWGAAKGYEALGESESIDRAKELYQKLAAEYPTSALGKDAKKQLLRLESDSTQQEIRELNKELSGKSK